MKEPWINDIRRRMDDFELDEPAGLWEAIEAGRAKPAPVAIRRPWRMWRRIAAAASVVALIGVGLGLLLRQPGNVIPVGNQTKISSVRNVIPATVTESIGSSGENNHVSHETILSKSAYTLTACNNISHNKNEIKSTADKDIQQENIIRESTNTETGETSFKNNYSQEQSRPQTDNNISPLYASSGIRIKKGSPAGKFTLGVFASGGNSSSKTALLTGSIVDTSLGPDFCSWEDSPLLGLLLFNKGNETTFRIRHRQPVTFGLSVSYGLTSRLAFESGLTYSRLSSDVREGSDSHYYTGEQTLHYVGLPLSLKYRVLSWKRLDIYGSAGGQVQKCVAGEVKKHYVISGEPKLTESEHITERSLQWSVNVAIGLQCRLTNLIGLYAEPGVSYHFDNGSSVRTIYKDKPVNFNFNLGLRFTLGE